MATDLSVAKDLKYIFTWYSSRIWHVKPIYIPRWFNQDQFLYINKWEIKIKKTTKESTTNVLSSIKIKKNNKRNVIGTPKRTNWDNDALPVLYPGPSLFIQRKQTISGKTKKNKYTDWSIMYILYRECMFFYLLKRKN